MKKIIQVLIIGVAITAVSCGGDDAKSEEKKEKAPKDVKDIEAPGAGAESCTYEFDASTANVSWVSYKHSSRVAVKGTFQDVSFDGETKGNTPHELIMGLTGTALTESVFSNDTLRDRKLRTFYFGNMESGDKLMARIIDLDPNYNENMDANGKCKMEITMNAVTFTIEAEFSLVQGIFTASGSLNMDDFSLDAAYDAIHEACAAKHTNEQDGKPITHKDVTVEVSTVLKKLCD